jgi:FRG domain-containing protein
VNDLKPPPTKKEAPLMGQMMGQLERDIYEGFKDMALPYSKDLPNVDWGNPWHRLCVAQHHGTPTRLLDWSDRYAVAAYFAVMDDAKPTDSALWCLDLAKLSSISNGKFGHRKKRHGFRIDKLPTDTSFFGDGSKPTIGPIHSIPDGIFAVIQPPDIAPRIVKQGGLFSVVISFDDSQFIWDHLPLIFEIEKTLGKGNHILHKITIPSANRPTIRTQLEESATDPSDLFPDLIGLGMYFSFLRSTDFNNNLHLARKPGGP